MKNTAKEVKWKDMMKTQRVEAQRCDRCERPKRLDYSVFCFKCLQAIKKHNKKKEEENKHKTFIITKHQGKEYN